MDADELAVGLFRILETGDSALAVEVVGEDNRNRESSVAPPACSLPGPAGTLASSAWMRSAFSDLRFPILGMARSDDQLWVRLRMRGLHTGPFVRFQNGKLDQAVPPTGCEIDFEQVHMLRIRDGRVVVHEALRDDMALLGQIKVFPLVPATALRMIAWKISGKAARAAADVAALASESAGLVQNQAHSMP